MHTKLQGELTLIFVMGGISKIKNNPYLQVSDGITSQFVTIPPNLGLTADHLSKYKRGDEIVLSVEVDPFAQRMVLLALPE